MLLESELVLWLIFGTTRDNIGQTMAPQLVRGGTILWQPQVVFWTIFKAVDQI